MEIKLYSESRAKNPETTGAPDQVFASQNPVTDLINKIEAGYCSSVLGPDIYGKATHAFYPKIRRKFNGEAIGIIGNASDAQGEFKLRYIPLVNICYFPTIETVANAPRTNRAPDPIPNDHLRGTPYEGKGAMHFCLWPLIVPLYFGQEVPYVNILESDGDAALQELGEGYARWGTANATSRTSSSNINAVMESLQEDERKDYLFPPGKEWKITASGTFIAFEDVSATDHPDLAAELRAFFLPQFAPHGGAPAPAIPGQVVPGACKIEVRTAEDDEKDATAKSGQTKCNLYLIGADVNWQEGTVTKVDVPVLSDSLLVVHAKPRSARVDAMQSMLQLVCETVKSEDPTSVFCKYASIDVVQRPVAANLLNGNLQFAPVTDVYSNSDLHDLTAFLAQRDIPKIERIKKEIQANKAQASVGVPDANRTPPKSYAEKIGSLKTCDDIMALAVNSSNVSSACVNVEQMDAKNMSCIHISLAKWFVNFMDADFDAWMRSDTGGGPNVHLTLFRFYDRATLHIAKFANNFKNQNILESGRPVTELDITQIKKAALVTKSMYEYFQRLFVCGQRDSSVVTVAHRPTVPATNVQVNNPPASKRPSTNENQPASQRTRVPTANNNQRFNLPSVPKFDPKEKGMFHLKNPSNKHPFPSDVEVCASFCCKGLECPHPRGECPDKHIFVPKDSNMHIIESVGDHFLATGTGWFDANAFRGVTLKPKYHPLRGNKNGPFVSGG